MTPGKPFRSPAILVAGALVLSCSDGTGPDFPMLEITTESLKDAVAGEPYVAGVDAAGGDGDYTWDVVQGELPPELDLSLATSPDDGDADALITGSAEEEGTHVFTLRVRSGDGQSAEREFALVVRPGGIELAIQNAGLPPALVGAAYAVPLRPVGGPSIEYEWRLAGGTLPAGLELREGRVQGTPTGTDTARVTIRLTSGVESVEETFELRVVENRAAGYQITVFEVAEVPAFVRPHLDAAVARWEAVITGDLQSLAFRADEFPSAPCDGFGQDVNGTSVDDLLLLVNITEIDGVGRVLGRAGACVIRNADTLPIIGVLTLDEADLAARAEEDGEMVEHLLIHEIGHVLGFGGLWREFDLVEGARTGDPRFTGEAAVEEWHALGGSGGVPLETQGGTGTAEVHWSEARFDVEVMTGFVEGAGVFQPLSRLSIASMSDLGYRVDIDAGDPFDLDASARLDIAAANAHRVHAGHDELLTGPVWVAGDGRSRPIAEPR